MKQRRSFGWCSHGTTITTITAGLAREVCETCGRVRIHYVERAVQIYPSQKRSNPLATGRPGYDEPEPAPGLRKCKLCSQVAIFMIPEGMVCDEHAWQAAAQTSWEEADPWVPIRIDKSPA